MANKTIPIILLLFIIQNFSFGQADTLSAFRLLERKIDSIVSFAIREEAFPGCVVYAAVGGEVLHFKSYGHHTYHQIQPVRTADVYDLASITKVTAATLSLMKLYELDLLDLDHPISEYVSGFGWNKRGKVTIRECLAHQSGLQSWIKYYEEIRKDERNYKRNTLSTIQSEKYPFQIAENLFLHKDFYSKIKKMIKKCDFDESRKMVYSGLFFYLVPEIVTTLSGMDFESFLDTHFYQKMGARTLTFNPLGKITPDRIVPTEHDEFFRNEQIHGMVHDEGAILMRGVSGNAGLFSNAEDLAKVWTMLLNEGEYEGMRYLAPGIVNLFTSYQYPANENRKGLGFDKPLLEYDRDKSSVAEDASPYSFGHTGYTGPIVWVDPANDLLFIFLTNRVYPGRDHRAIYTYNIRPTIHQLFYTFLSGRIREIENN